MEFKISNAIHCANAYEQHLFTSLQTISHSCIANEKYVIVVPKTFLCLRCPSVIEQANIFIFKHVIFKDFFPRETLHVIHEDIKHSCLHSEWMQGVFLQEHFNIPFKIDLGMIDY